MRSMKFYRNVKKLWMIFAVLIIIALYNSVFFVRLRNRLFKPFKVHKTFNVSVVPNSFYLIESGEVDKGFVLKPRQACAVESAARANAKSEIYFFMTSHVSPDDVLMAAIDSYDNVHIVGIDLESFLQDTPLEVLYESGKIMQSQYRIAHTSDVLRYATLYRYPGTYLDSDFVVMASLENMTNYAGAEDRKNVAAGVISFGSDNNGREMAKECAEKLSRLFNGNQWRANGPEIIQNMAMKRCRSLFTRQMKSRRCNGFQVKPVQMFYPIHESKWQRFFTEEKAYETMQQLITSPAVHVWNYHSAKQTLSKHAHAPYILLAKKFCPKVFARTVDYF